MDVKLDAEADVKMYFSVKPDIKEIEKNVKQCILFTGFLFWKIVISENI